VSGFGEKEGERRRKKKRRKEIRIDEGVWVCEN
jgi:hypothetical protein